MLDPAAHGVQGLVVRTNTGRTATTDAIRPKLRARIKDCYPWGSKPALDCKVSRSREKAFFGEVSDALASLAKNSNKNLKVFDQFSLFCKMETCGFRDENGPFIAMTKWNTYRNMGVSILRVVSHAGQRLIFRKC